MAVIESKGNGYSLYNCVKLPSLPEYDIEKYPYAMLIHLGTTTVRLFITSTYPYTWSNSKQALEYEAHFRCGWNTRIGDAEWETTNTNYQVSAGTALASWKPIWSNYDIINTTDNSVYLATSEPIPLDGMNVIEWDGDTEGLTASDSYYRVADFYPATNAVGVEKWDEGIDVGDVFAVNSTGGWSVKVGSNTIIRANATLGIQLKYVDENNYTCLLAYNPIEEVPTVDYTISYQTAHGAAPASKTITVNEGESYALTEADLPALFADGYIFGGWSVNGVVVSAGYEISADTVLVAVWVEDLPVSQIDPTSMLIGWLVGRRIAMQRK